MTKLFNKLPQKVRKAFCIVFILFVVAAISAAITSYVIKKNDNNADKDSLSSPAISSGEKVLSRPTKSELEFAQAEALDATYTVDFFDVGNADCTLFANGDKAMLIDTGDKASTKYIEKQLTELSITSLDYVVITNENETHTGGLIAILEDYAVDTLIVPDINTENRTLQSCFEVARNNGVTIKQAHSLDAWNIGEAQVQILSATENVIIRITVLTYSFLLMSDASPEEEMALLELDMDITAAVLKASQRGSADTSSNAFLKMVQPEYVVVSSENGVADVHTISRLIEYAGGVYVTDNCGTISFLTNGKNFKVKTDRNDFNLSSGDNNNIFMVP